MVTTNRLQPKWLGERGHESGSMPTMADIRQSAQSAFDACPVGAAFTAFGLGFTLGIAVAMLFEPEQKPARTWW